MFVGSEVIMHRCVWTVLPAKGKDKYLESFFYTPNIAFSTYRKHFIRAFSSKYTYEDAFGLARDKKFWSEAAKGITVDSDSG